MMILLLPLLLGLGGCKDDSDSLPPITQTGAYTFGCKINGKVWSVSGVGKQNNIGATWQFDFLDIVGSTSEIGLRIIIKHEIDESLKEINLKDSTFVHDLIFEYKGEVFDKYDLLFGEILFSKIDIQNRIISGTFSLEFLRNNNQNEIHLELTEGRFDIPRVIF